MSKFKRSFFSPHQLYKTLYTGSALSDTSSESSSRKSPTQIPGLHLCRDVSVVFDNLEVAKENKSPPMTTNPQHFSAAPIRNAPSDVDPLQARAAEDDNGKQIREPLNALSWNSLNGKAPITKPSLRRREQCAKEAPVFEPSTPQQLCHVWDDDTNCDAAPVSSWSAFGNRYLLCRPLPLDVGRCACYILHEREAAIDGHIVYSLYTDEGHGRQDRKLAVARHRRRPGRSEFIIAQNEAGTSLTKREEGFLGRVTSNIVGSRYSIWSEDSSSERKLLGVVMFEPTMATLTGTFKVMRVYIPKYHSLYMNNNNNTLQHDPVGLPKDWEENSSKAFELCSRKPQYNRLMKRYELDYRDRTRPGYKIQTSSKNFQLVMEEHGKQVILLHGKVSNSKYIMEYRFPLTAYQAFGICLASIDSKLCCSV